MLPDVCNSSDVPRLSVTKGLSSVRARALQCWCSNVCCCCLLPLVTVGGCHLCFGGLCWEVVRLFVFVLGKEDNTNSSTLHRMIGFVQFPWLHCCPNTLWGVSVIAVKRLLVNPRNRRRKTRVLVDPEISHHTAALTCLAILQIEQKHKSIVQCHVLFSNRSSK